MNAVEIEEAVSRLVEGPFDKEKFPFLFLEAFGNKEATIRRLKSGGLNQSDIPGGVLQRGNIHILTCEEGKISKTLDSLRNSPATSRYKSRIILATDGKTIEAENLAEGETLCCEYQKLADHFGFFLALAGISTVKEIRENAFDIKATGRLNRLYVELLKENPKWGTKQRQHDMNHFMARLIFCFFAEDTGIFKGGRVFTATIERMSERDSSNTHDILEELFRSMNTPIDQRQKEKIRQWANEFPYVNGGLFSGSSEVPKFSKIARSYLLHVGNLDWTQINPDIFGSMIQAVADEEERGVLGMHYTSVPNILKVLNPLFLDNLRSQLDEAGENSRKLLNLRNRISRIRVFDPACGSGNFLVIAYKELRAIEHQINTLRGESGRRSEIPKTNFRGIEARHFSCEIARLALIIAEYQCDVLYRGQRLALAEFLPLDSANWITCGNALRLDWLSICPPTGKGVKNRADDLFATPLNQAEINFENEGGETFICGNPPYKGSKWQTPEQKEDLKLAWTRFPKLAKTTDYVSGWVARYLDYTTYVPDSAAAFVATNSICQGQQASEIWPAVFSEKVEIRFAYLPFKWSNLASHNAGVTVIIIGLSKQNNDTKKLYDDEMMRECQCIGPYLVPNRLEVIEKQNEPTGDKGKMLFGNMPRDGGHLFLTHEEVAKLIKTKSKKYVKKFVGSEELINGKERYVLWINEEEISDAAEEPLIQKKLKLVKENRQESDAQSTREFSNKPYRFVQIAGCAAKAAIVVPRVSSENRDYLPVDYLTNDFIVGDRNFALYDAPLWNLALIASRLHWVWIGTVCVRMRTDFSYSNTLGWNTFPLPKLTEKNKNDLNRCAENILIEREKHFPATIADLYKPQDMPKDLKNAHELNDETLERIFIGRRFKNDTERLEKMLDLYSQQKVLGQI